MPVSQLEIDAIRKSPNNTVLLDIDGGPVLRSWLAEDFGYTLGNSWDSFFESVSGRADQGLNLGGSLFNGMGASVAQMKISNVGQTVVQWTGSDRPVYQLNLFFIALRPDQDVRAPIIDLQKLVLPEIGYVVMDAPNKYSWSAGLKGGTITGGVGLKIGNWFATPNVFVVGKVNPVFSKATTSRGLPLFAAAQVQLEAFRMMSASEVNSWFVQPVQPSGDFYSTDSIRSTSTGPGSIQRPANNRER